MITPFDTKECGEPTTIAVIGGGIVGLATALTIGRRLPGVQVTVLEAERDVAMHQSGHNSGVLHAGLYYKPGSLKATACRSGKQAMEQFCQDEGVPWDRCGKVIVATNEQELPRLDSIAERAEANGVDFTRINTDQLRKLEPAAAGLAGIHVPETGIVNYATVCQAMARRIEQAGGTIVKGYDVQEIETRSQSTTLTSRRGRPVDCDFFINCGGLRCDRVYEMAGGQTDIKVVPFRGEYYELLKSSESLCRNLIYPVPDPSFPFLGVHFTRMIDGGVECGPNAVLAMSRTGYRWRDINVGDLIETLGYAGFRKLAVKHWRMGLGEMYRSVRKDAFVKALQKLIPSIQSSDLKVGRTGVRAQTVTPEGNLVDDFLLERGDRSLHVLNAPSPAATSSLAIADLIVDKIA